MAEKILYRSLQLDNVRAANDKERSIEASLSSETPIERWHGTEILSHEPSAIKLDRADSMPLLWQHDTSEQIGAVEGLKIIGKKLRGVLRFGNSQRAKELWADIKDGLVKSVSIGYQILEQEPVDKDKYRVTLWELLEVSLVSIPADASVGIGRSKNFNGGLNSMENISESTDVRVSENKERQRVVEILAIGKRFKQDEAARKYVEDGGSIEEFRHFVLERMGHAKPINNMDAGESFLDRRELNQYSLCRAINALINKDWSSAGFEIEVSRELAKKRGRDSAGLIIPFEAMQIRTVAKSGSGANVIATEVLADNFIEMLRNKSLCMALGATILSGLTGNISIPKQSGAASTYWVAEDSNITASDQTFAAVALSPKTCGALTKFTRKMLLQSTPAIENLIRSDLAAVVGIALDLAAINGSGTSNQPTGILNTSGIGDVAGGVNGLIPTWAHIVELETDIAAANADIGSMGYLTSPEIRGRLKQVQRFTSTDSPIWSLERIGDFESMNSYKAAASNQIPKTLVKGTSSNCHAIIFGNWKDLLIATWGNGVELAVDEATYFAAGSVQIRALLDADIAVRNASSFSAMKDALIA